MRTICTLSFTLLLTGIAHAQIPVTDIANLTNNRVAHIETIAQWVENIAQLRTQIEQLDEQIRINGDIRAWTGNPAEAAAHLGIDMLGIEDLAREYGRTREEILALEDSLSSLRNTRNRTYRAIDNATFDGERIRFDEMTFRRYSILNEQQRNYEEVFEETNVREEELQEELALTIEDLKGASTDAEVQKQAAKIDAINGQLAALASERRDRADQVVAQKIANDSRIEEERLAATELEMRDVYLGNQRITAFMRGIKFRQQKP